MEERRGESSDSWMKKAGPSMFFTIEEARARAQGECDAEGIDPTLSNAERCGRLIDIQQGSPLMHEERQRKAAYKASKFNAHVNDVVKHLPQTIAEQQAVDRFHTELKAKLGQTNGAPAMEHLTTKTLFSI